MASRAVRVESLLHAELRALGFRPDRVYTGPGKAYRRGDLDAVLLAEAVRVAGQDARTPQELRRAVGKEKPPPSPRPGAETPRAPAKAREIRVREETGPARIACRSCRWRLRNQHAIPGELADAWARLARGDLTEACATGHDCAGATTLLVREALRYASCTGKDALALYQHSRSVPLSRATLVEVVKLLLMPDTLAARIRRSPVALHDPGVGYPALG